MVELVTEELWVAQLRNRERSGKHHNDSGQHGEWITLKCETCHLDSEVPLSLLEYQSPWTAEEENAIEADFNRNNRRLCRQACVTAQG